MRDKAAEPSFNPPPPSRCTIRSVLGNVTSALKAKGMWNETFMIFSSDNGSALRYPGLPPSLFLGGGCARNSSPFPPAPFCAGGPTDIKENAANNYPLRGVSFGPRPHPFVCFLFVFRLPG